jgi:asparagine synthase (glutamine-hydrolysing)
VPDRRTGGDTELVAHLGDDLEMIARFRGMYAYALHRPDGTVHLVRDRFGIKPLYFSVRDGVLMYASQLRCFAQDPLPATIDPAGAASLLRFGCVIGTTMFEGVYELPPGHCLRWRAGRILDIVPTLSNVTETPDLGDALRRSVARHLVADVPTCVLLSGGLDSAVVAKLAAESGNRPPVAITLSVGGAIDEVDRAAATAREYGLEHEIAPVATDYVTEIAKEFLDAMDQPTIDGLNTFLVCRAVSRLGFKVALSGLGADELFGGYAVYRQVELASLTRMVPTSIMRPLLRRGTGLNPAKVDAALTLRHDRKALARLSREIRSATDPVAASSLMRGVTNPVMDSEISHYLRPMLLRDTDAFSMASSVELRVPFLDDEVLAAGSKRSTARTGLEGKRAIVKALGDDHLERVMAHPKTGFRLPMEDWLGSFTVGSDAVPQELPWPVRWSDYLVTAWPRRWAKSGVNTVQAP